MIPLTPSLTHKNGDGKSPWWSRNIVGGCLLLLIVASVWQPSALQTQSSTMLRTTKSLTVSGAWYTFKGPDDDFTLSFPGKPIPSDVSPGPLTDIREFRFTTTDGMTFAINFHDIGGDPRSAENNQWGSELEQILSDFDRSQGLRVVQMHRLAKNSVEAELWQNVPETSSTINYLRRSIIRRARVYTLSCGWLINGKEVDKATCRRFFNSFHFTTGTGRHSLRHRR